MFKKILVSCSVVLFMVLSQELNENLKKYHLMHFLFEKTFAYAFEHFSKLILA